LKMPWKNQFLEELVYTDNFLLLYNAEHSRTSFILIVLKPVVRTARNIQIHLQRLFVDSSDGPTPNRPCGWADEELQGLCKAPLFPILHLCIEVQYECTNARTTQDAVSFKSGSIL
jgi:hypothetical protein